MENQFQQRHMGDIKGSIVLSNTKSEKLVRSEHDYELILKTNMEGLLLTCGKIMRNKAKRITFSEADAIKVAAELNARLATGESCAGIIVTAL